MSNSRPKIAFYINSLEHSGGAERVITILVNKLCDSYEVYLFLLNEATPFYKVNPEVNIIPLVPKVIPSSGVFAAIKSNVRIVRKVMGAIKKHQIDLLVTFMTTTNITGMIAAKLTKRPVIMSERNFPTKQRMAQYWRSLRKLLYPYADYLVVQTAEIKSHFVDFMNRDKIVILPNPISPDLTEATTKAYPKKSTILNVGRLNQQKAQHILIRAFALLQPCDWNLTFVGEGDRREELEQLVTTLGLDEKVQFPGSTKAIYEQYGTAKVFAFSSIYEGFPNALIEAMHFGMPCVSTDCPTGPSELIEDGHNGYLIPMNDEKIMAEKLRVLIDDEEKRATFGGRAKETVAKFKAAAVVKSWATLIDTALKN